MRRVPQAHAGGGAFTCAAGGLPGLGFGVVSGMPHRDVGDDAFSAVPVLGDHVVRKPYARLLLDGVHRNGEWSDALIQIVPVRRRSIGEASSSAPRYGRCALAWQPVAIAKISV